MKKNKGTGVMLGAIIIMVVIVAAIFIFFFINGGGRDYNYSINDIYNGTDENSNEETNVEITDEVDVNQIEVIDINESNSTNQDIENSAYDESFLGNYIWEEDYDIIRFSLFEEDDGIHYSMSYYPNESSHASEELTGLWSTAQNIVSVDNTNEDAIATYSFCDIVYNEDGTMEINIQAKEIVNSARENYRIPDGKYTFEKED